MRKFFYSSKMFIGKLLLVIIIVASGNSNLFGQLIGTKTIGTDYASLALAIADLNTQGVGTGGVTFNLPAGYTETFASPTAGVITATGTAANPILFHKSSSGANPKITAGVGTGALDGIIVITGGDYITFDGIDLSENVLNTTATTQMEWGYALLKRNATAPFDGCQYVTIKNCSITLNKANTGSFGIFCNNQTATSATALTITATSDAMNNCKFYNNTITNSYYGIYLLGYNAAAPYFLYDQNNEIGVSGGNNISNWGGSSVAAYGIYAAYQDFIKVSNNIVNGGAGTTTTVYGIVLGTSTSSNADIVGNTVTISSSATTTSFAAIYNSAGGTTLYKGNIVNIANNIIQNCTYSTATSGAFYGIVSTTSPFNLNIYGNTVSGNSKTATSGVSYGIQALGGTNINCYSNIIHDNSITGASATGTIYGIYVSGTTQFVETYHDNTIYMLTNANTGSVTGIYLSSSSGAKTTYNNTIHDLSSVGGAVYGVNAGAGLLHNFYKNKIYNLSASAAAGTVYGVSFAPTTLNMYNNYIYGLTTPAATGTNAINGINLSGGSYANVYFNTVYLNASSTSVTTFGTTGIYASTTPTLDLRNNIIVNSSTPVGAAYTVAYRRSSSTLTSYAATSNNNDFYAGTPGLNNLIYYDATNSDQTIAAYQTRVSSKDRLSFSELPNFVTFSGNPCGINTAIATKLESGGSQVNTSVAITDDYFANTRNVSTPDVGAQEFSGILLDVNAPAISYTALGNTYSATLTATITDPSGVPVAGPGRPTLYWKINTGSYTAVTGSYIGSNQFTFTFGGGASIGDVVSYYIVAQDNAGTPNVGSYPSVGAGGFSINPPAASTPTSAPSSYIVTASPLAGDYTVGTSLFNKITGKNIYFEKSIAKVIVQQPVLQDNQGTVLQKKQGTVIDKQLSSVLQKKQGTLLELKNDVISTNLVDNCSDETKLVEVDQVNWIPMENGKKYDGPLYIKKSENPGYNYPTGVNGVYATITAAVADLNLRGVSAPTRFLLTDASYSTGETFPITINITNANLPTATNTVTFKPNTGVTTTVTGTVTSTALFKLFGADYIIIDGSNSVGGTSRDLTLTSLTPSTITAAIVWIGSASAFDGANYNVIKNCNLIGTGGSTPTVLGVLSGSGTTIGNSAEAPNTNNTIQNNSFIALQNGIYHYGFALAPFDQNLTVTGNSLGSDAAPLIFRGIITLNSQNFNISGNTISGVVSTSTSTSTMVGIQIGQNIVGGTINANTINNVNQTNSAATYSAAGILLGASTYNSNVTVTNNMIRNIVAYGNLYLNAYNGYGIYLSAGGGYKLYYNSVRLSTNQTATNSIPVGLLVNYGMSTPGSIDVRDNIFDVDETPSAGDAFAIACMVPLQSFLNLNYNDYYTADGYDLAYYNYYNGTNGIFAGTLAQWQSATGQDANSVSADPDFISTTDLHIVTTSGSLVSNAGTPITGITTDIDGDTRSATTPDIGADEFSSVVTLTLTAFLEGYCNAGGTAMNFAPSVTVELHNSTAPYALVESHTGILSTAGVGTFNFTTAVNGTPYYIAVKTWNTVETWSATAQSFTSGALSYDFTTLQTSAYLSNMKQAGTGTLWCVYSGDVNQDGFVNLGDYNSVNNDSYNQVTGVVVTDVTGDQFTNLADYNIVNNNSYNQVKAHTFLVNPATGVTKPMVTKPILKRAVHEN